MTTTKMSSTTVVTLCMLTICMSSGRAVPLRDNFPANIGGELMLNLPLRVEESNGATHGVRSIVVRFAEDLGPNTATEPLLGVVNHGQVREVIGRPRRTLPGIDLLNIFGGQSSTNGPRNGNIFEKNDDSKDGSTNGNIFMKNDNSRDGSSNGNIFGTLPFGLGNILGRNDDSRDGSTNGNIFMKNDNSRDGSSNVNIFEKINNLRDGSSNGNIFGTLPFGLGNILGRNDDSRDGSTNGNIFMKNDNSRDGSSNGNIFEKINNLRDGSSNGNIFAVLPFGIGNILERNDDSRGNSGNGNIFEKNDNSRGNSKNGNIFEKNDNSGDRSGNINIFQKNDNSRDGSSNGNIFGTLPFGLGNILGRNDSRDRSTNGNIFMKNDNSGDSSSNGNIFEKNENSRDGSRNGNIFRKNEDSMSGGEGTGRRTEFHLINFITRLVGMENNRDSASSTKNQSSKNNRSSNRHSSRGRSSEIRSTTTGPSSNNRSSNKSSEDEFTKLIRKFSSRDDRTSGEATTPRTSSKLMTVTQRNRFFTKTRVLFKNNTMAWNGRSSSEKSGSTGTGSVIPEFLLKLLNKRQDSETAPGSGAPRQTDQIKALLRANGNNGLNTDGDSGKDRSERREDTSRRTTVNKDDTTQLITGVNDFLNLLSQIVTFVRPLAQSLQA